MDSIFLEKYLFSDVIEANRYFSILFKKVGKFFDFPKKTEKKLKVHKSAKKSNEKMNILFSVFGYPLFFASIVSPGSQKIFRKYSIGTCRSIISIMRENQNAWLVLNFFDVVIPFSPKIQDSVLSFRSQS